MAHSVRSAALFDAEDKLNRARIHKATLQGEMASFGKEHPRPFDTMFVDDGSPNLIVITVSRVDDAPWTMAALLGDIVHNLRSALDYIAWQIVAHGSQAGRLTPEQEESVSFPIVVGPSRRGLPAADYFARKCATQLSGISDACRSILGSHQPYRRTNLPEHHPLALLQALSNTDKHRAINPVLWAPQKMGFTVVDRPTDCRILGIQDGPGAIGKALRVGAEVGYVTVADKAACHGLEVEDSVTISISLENGLNVYEASGWMEAEVASILTEIDAVL